MPSAAKINLVRAHAVSVGVRSAHLFLLGQAEPLPDFNPAPPVAHETDLWPQAAKLAVDFWARVAQETEISVPFRRIAAQAGDTLGAMRKRFG